MSVIRPRDIAPALQSFAVLTPTLAPATHTNSYILGEDELLVVEPATPHEGEQHALVEHLRMRIADGARIKAFFVTHHHVDHVGGLPALSDAVGAPVWAHRATAERIASHATIDRTFEDGDSITLGSHTLNVLHTPGHAAGHLCLQHRDARWMIAGDMVASIGTILVDAVDGDMQAYLASLERMRTFGPSMLLPAHGDPIADADAKLSGYVAHRLLREQKALAALTRADGPATLQTLVPDAYSDAPPALWPLAMLSLEAHLIKLEREGRVHRTGDYWRLA